MNKKLIFYIVALTAGLLTACSSDDEQKQEPPVRHISVEVSERPMAEEGTAEGRSLMTRAAITTTETLGNFTMQGVYDGSESPKNYSVEKSTGTGQWAVKPDSWPSVDNNTKVQFYAYTNGAFDSTNGTPFIDFTVAENASTQHDLLVAKNSVAYSDHDSKVPLTFDHACAALAFNVFMSNTLSTNLAGKTLTVSSIMLKNVSNTGKYYFETAAWGDVSGSADYTLNNSTMTIDIKPQALSSNHLFMIPQKRDANGTVGTYLEINYTLSGSKQATIPLAVDWVAGSKYTIDIKLGTGLIQ